MSAEPIAVIGGGVVGLACAYYLRRDGHEVLVVEAAQPGSGASSGNAGWIVPSLSGPLPGPGRLSFAARSLLDRSSPLRVAPRALPSLAGWLLAFARHCNAREHLAGLHATAAFGATTMALFDELAAAGVEFEMARRGMLFAFLDERAGRAQLRGLAPLRAHGYDVAVEPLGASDARALEPALSRRVQAAVMVDGERDVVPISLVRGLAERLEAMGARLLNGRTVRGFSSAGGRVSAVHAGAEEIAVSGVVVAGGATSGALTRLLGRPLPVQAGKGYSVSVDVQPRPARPLYLGEAMIGCTPMNGHLRLAGTMELSGTRESFDARRVRAMTAGAAQYLAGPCGPARDHWVGMRAITPDGLPVVGRLEPWSNAFVATGHGMLGVTLAPATGEAVARLVRGDRTPLLDPFSPGRFRRRSGAGRRAAPA